MFRNGFLHPLLLPLTAHIHPPTIPMSDENVHRFKLVVLGDTGVGKTSLIVRFVRDAFRKFEATTGGTFYTKNVELEDDFSSTVKFIVWDTSGEERFRPVAPLYYRGASVAIVVYDVTSYPSLVAAKSWIEELKERGDDTMMIVLVGNKVDLEPSKNTITFCEAEFYAQEYDFLHLGTSAKTAKNVETLFFDIARELPKPELVPPDEEEDQYQDVVEEEEEEDDDDATTTTTPLVDTSEGNEEKTTARQRLASVLCCFKRKRNPSETTRTTRTTTSRQQSIARRIQEEINETHFFRYNRLQ